MEAIANLPSPLPDSDFDKAQTLISSQENSFKSEVESDFFEELPLKEVEKIEAQHRCHALEKEMRALKSQCAELEKEIEGGEEIRRNLEEEKKRRVLLERAAEELQKEVLQWKKKHKEVALRVSMLMEENTRLRISWEQKQVVLITDSDNEDDEDVTKFAILTPTPKSKRGLRIVISDTESEEEGSDRIPISKLKRMRGLRETELENEGSDDLGVQNSSFCLDDNKNETPSRRRLFRLRECSRKTKETDAHTPPGSPFKDQSPSMISRRTSSSRTAVKKRLVYSGRVDDDDNDSDEGTSGSKSENSSLGGFIVNESDNSEDKVSSRHASEEESAGDEDESTSDENLDDILAKIRRRRDSNYKWGYEADMLASFAKDPRLCMEAVCVLYRMQTAEEKSVKETIMLNKRGFNTCDAHRGSMIAEFLMDGHLECQLRKSVEELKMYDPTGPDYCHKLANHYSKQLFNIYMNKEDPFFPPS